MEHIPFNKPFFTGKETDYIQQAVTRGKISGNGYFTQKCHSFFKEKYGFKHVLLTQSCTDALEMAAILADIKEGDEVIVPSYTFVSTANAFVLRGAKIIFADSRSDHPGIDEDKIEELITSKTKVIVPVHYAGVACDMDLIMSLSEKYNLLVIEDAAQSIDSFYIGAEGVKKPLGSIGHLSTFSFHETKNIISGEGGMLVINDERFIKRAEIIWEKGTNRSAFSKGEVDKYGWVDIGSSFLPSEITAAFLWAQLENLADIQEKRLNIWKDYYHGLKKWGEEQQIDLPLIPDYATNNAHMFYLKCRNLEQRDKLLKTLNTLDINAVFHYLSLHKSMFYVFRYEGEELENSIKFSDCLIRLPFYIGIPIKDVITKIINA